MTYSPQVNDPPNPETADGKIRRVGVELEFGGVTAERAAQIVQSVCGGEIKALSEHRYKVDTPDFSEFVIEIDSQYAHPREEWQDPADADSFFAEIDKSVSKAVGDLSQGIVPTEIVGPPMPYTELDTFSPILDALREDGARGTDQSFVAGFGLHLNPEVASTNPKDITSVLQAYVISSPDLRASIEVDLTRRVLPFIDPFPKSYMHLLLASDYQPDLKQLIDDYLEHNPTRNRELDLLPLFKHLDEDRIVQALNDARIKARPTYHYRLPNMKLSDDSWSVVTEWNRWVEVEQLAADAKALRKAADAFLNTLATDDSFWHRVFGSAEDKS
ncbi:MAG: amidoligase family protein [Rhodospirillaceae bacterium]